MPIKRNTFIYSGPGGPFEGLVAVDTDWGSRRPGVMIVPNVLGPKEIDFTVAERIADLGYVAMVADVYGQGNRATREDELPTRFMDALNDDRKLLRDRLLASLSVLKTLDEVNPKQVAAIGYCFGGKSVLDLVRCGADVLGVVSFHGVYDRPSYANVETMTAKVLVCHGWTDFLAPPSVTLELAQELSEGSADWQLHAYGDSGHGFTDPTAKGTDAGYGYRPRSDVRSWQAMENFLAELFV